MADFKILVYILVFVSTYSAFNYYFALDQVDTYDPNMPEQNYTEPSSSSFFSTLDDMTDISFSDDLWFISVPLLTLFSFSLVYMGLRYLRGIG